MSIIKFTWQIFLKTVKKYGGIDIFVSNAAVNPSFGPLFDVIYFLYLITSLDYFKYSYYIKIDESSWEKIFDTNVKSTFFFIKEALPHLQKRKLVLDLF